jgi:hypothetical protein
MPVVTVRATDPIASWSGDSGIFTFIRTGNPTQTLNVFYRISGTASNGIDYQAIPNLVQLPSGVYSNTVVVTQINTGQTTVKTVTLSLGPPPYTTPPINYTIGCPDRATVYIVPSTVADLPPAVSITGPPNGSVFAAPVDVRLSAVASDPDGSVSSVEFFAGSTSLGVVTNWVVVDPLPGSCPLPGQGFLFVWSNAPPGTNIVLTAKATDNGGASTTSDPITITIAQKPPPTNVPPFVSISTPPAGATFYTPVDIPICANAGDVDDFVATVEFFAGTNSLGITTNNPFSTGPRNPFCLVWSNAPVGTYALTAKATDSRGASTVSDPIAIAVLPGPPPTNLPPVVRITSPPNGAVFHSPVNLPLLAYANDKDGFVTSVEFFADSSSLGLGRPISVTTLPPGPTNVWVLIWSNAPPGTNIALTAKATDNGGASTVSDPVRISIVPSGPPPTNRPPAVSIVATDPIAIEGTNCWPWLGLVGATPTWSNWTCTTAVCRLFTNCGPKNATFTVRRFGDTNSDVTVSYAIGGTATNGVDYVALPGSVTIPAGQRQALITIVPIDDGPPDLNSTIILKLLASAVVPPEYLVGYPAGAEAIILDKGPRPASGVMPDKTFHLSSTGPDGAWFHVEYSTDMLNWTPICTNQVVNGAIDFLDPDAQSSQLRFYRAVPEEIPPAQ